MKKHLLSNLLLLYSAFCICLLSGNNELSGVLSSKIDSITGLKALDIGKSGNPDFLKSFSIPDDKSFFEIKFEGNNAFRGEIPSTLGNLPALKVLNLGKLTLMTFCRFL